MILPQWLTDKESAYNAEDTGDTGSIEGWGRSPEEGNGNPLQHFCLKKPTDRGAWQDTVQSVPTSWTRLSDHASMHLTLREGLSLPHLFI